MGHHVEDLELGSPFGVTVYKASLDVCRGLIIHHPGVLQIQAPSFQKEFGGDSSKS